MNQIITITWPSWVWKTKALQILQEHFNKKIQIIPQITKRWKREDDNSDYISNYSHEEFERMKRDFVVFHWSYWIKLPPDFWLNPTIPVFILWAKELMKIHRRTPLKVFSILLMYRNYNFNELCARIKKRWDRTSNLTRTYDYNKWLINQILSQHDFLDKYVSCTIFSDNQMEEKLVWTIKQLII